MQAVFRSRPLGIVAFAVIALVLGACKPGDPAAETRARDAQIAATLTAAQRQIDTGHAAAGLAALQKLRTDHPDRADVLATLAFAQAQEDDNAEASASFEAAANKDSNRRALLVYAAGLDEKAGDHRNAARLYQAYLQYFPNDAAALKNLALVDIALNDPPSALDAYLKSINSSGDQQPVATADAAAIAQLFLETGNDAQAETRFRDVLQHQPDAPTAALARLGLLEISVRQKNWDAADKLIAELDADPASRDTLNVSPLAAARDRLREWHDAQDALAHEQAAAAESARQRAAQLQALADAPAEPEPAAAPKTEPTAAPEQSATTATPEPPAPSLIVSPPTEKAAPTLTGNVEANNALVPDALAMTAVASAPTPSPPISTPPEENPAPLLTGKVDVTNPLLPAVDNPPANTVDGNVSMAIGPLPASPAVPITTPASASAAASVNDNTPAARTAALIAEGRTAHDEGRFPDAIRAYSKAVALDDTAPETWLALAQTYFDNKQFSEAGTYAQEAIRRAPTDPAFTAFYLQVVKAGQTPARYYSELNDAYVKFPASADITFTLAEYLREQNDSKDAATVYNNFLVRSPDDPGRPEVEAALRALNNP